MDHAHALTRRPTTSLLSLLLAGDHHLSSIRVAFFILSSQQLARVGPKRFWTPCVRMAPAVSSNAGFRFSTGGEWVLADAIAGPACCLGRPLRCATLNCLHDLSHNKELLQPPIRQDAICSELAALDADVIGLNEVTLSLLQRLLHEQWVRDSYVVSAVPGEPRCSHLSTVQSGTFGNLLLSKIAPESVEYFDQPGGDKQSHAMVLRLRGSQSEEPRRVAVCSAHFTAFPWLMENRRRAQLSHLSAALATSSDGGGFDACVVMGDFNFHREAENASIPVGWSEVRSVVALGDTWDYGRNAMLAHYLPLRNIYNGLGLGASFGWSSSMRLDRILVHGAGLDHDAAEARLFADQPIHERARGRASLPQVGPELRAAHRALPWQEYLHPSDHFGIVVELPLAAGAPPSHGE